MKVRKTVSLFLSAFLLASNLNSFNLNAFAEEESDFDVVYVSTVVNGKSQNLPAIKNKDGEVFLSGKTLSDITVYQNNTSPTIFQHDKANDNNKYREILIDKNSKNAQIVSFWSGEPIIKKTISLPDIIENEGELYFSVAEMLPLLNSNAEVTDNKLYIENVPYSLSNIMPEFNISDYMFNIYGGDTKLLSGYSYLFNGLVDFELKKFVPIVGTRLNRIESYKDIFTSFLAEDEVYLEAVNNEEHWSSPIVDYVYGDASDRKDAIVEAFDEMTGISNEEHDELVKTFSTLDSWTTEYTTIDALGKGAKGLDFGLKAAAYIELYYDHVSDHYEMLDAVYDFEATKKENEKKVIAILEESYAAAENINSQFNDEKKHELIKGLAGQVGMLYIDEFKDELLPSGPLTYAKLGSVISKLYFIATDSYVYNVARKCEDLPYYNKLMERGASKFWQYNNSYDNISKDNIEKVRLSAIFTLLSSRSMYQAMCDSEKALGNNGNIYQKKIDSINEVLKKLYLAKNCCLTDSEEYIDNRIEGLKQSISNISIVDNQSSTESFEAYKAYFLDNYSLDDLVCLADVTHDGYDEMIIVTEGEYKGNPKFTSSIKGIVYTINNGEIVKIYEKNGSASHSGGFFEWYLTQDGNLEDGTHSMWHGIGEQRFEEYYLTNSGERIEVDTIVLSDKTSPVRENGEVTDEAYQDYVNKINKKVEQSFLIYSSWSSATVLPQFIELDPRKIFNIEEKSNNEINEIPFYGKRGVVSTENTGLNLRKYASSYADVILEIPQNANVTILESLVLLSDTNRDDNKWLLVDYNNNIGYVCADYIKTTNEKVSLSERQLISIAQLRYYEGLNAIEWSMSPCFEHNRDVMFHESEYMYTLLNDIHTKEDWLDNVHMLFSDKYDEFYKYDEIINMNGDKGYPYYLEKDNNWYENDLIHRKGALHVDLLFSDKHNIISIAIASINDNEVFFNGNVDWSKGKNSQIYSDYKDISGFSIVYEDDHWKCGKIER